MLCSFLTRFVAFMHVFNIMSNLHSMLMNDPALGLGAEYFCD